MPIVAEKFKFWWFSIFFVISAHNTPSQFKPHIGTHFIENQTQNDPLEQKLAQKNSTHTLGGFQPYRYDIQKV